MNKKQIHIHKRIANLHFKRSLSLSSSAHMEQFYECTFIFYCRRLYESAHCFELENIHTDVSIYSCDCRNLCDFQFRFMVMILLKSLESIGLWLSFSVKFMRNVFEREIKRFSQDFIWISLIIFYSPQLNRIATNVKYINHFHLNLSFSEYDHFQQMIRIQIIIIWNECLTISTEWKSTSVVSLIAFVKYRQTYFTSNKNIIIYIFLMCLFAPFIPNVWYISNRFTRSHVVAIWPDQQNLWNLFSSKWNVPFPMTRTPVLCW